MAEGRFFKRLSAKLYERDCAAFDGCGDDQPNARKADQSVDERVPDVAFFAEYGAHKVEFEEPDKPPIQRPDDHKDKRNYIDDGHKRNLLFVFG